MLTIQFDKASLCTEYYEQLVQSISTYGYETGIVLMDHSGEYTNLCIENVLRGEEEAPINEVIANVLTNVTIRSFLSKWIVEWVREGYRYSDPFEVEEITILAKDIFLNGRDKLAVNVTFQEWQQDIKDTFRFFLLNTISFSFDSFIRFRLKGHREQLFELVGKAIDEYKLEHYYQNMLDMCRKYLKDHKPKIEKISLHLNKDVSMTRLDGEEISIYELQKFTSEKLSFDYPLPMKERVIGPLVSMAPKQVVVYANSHYKGLIQTLAAIFEERLVVKENAPFI